MFKFIALIFMFLTLVVGEAQRPALALDPTVLCQSSRWMVDQNGDEVRIFAKRGREFPQYGALDLASSYFRLNYGSQSGWGTSIVLLPSFWSSGTYYQGAPVTLTCDIRGRSLTLHLNGTIGGLNVSETVKLSPPSAKSIKARVTASLTGSVPLDNRPGEAFKLMMLSSMHISDEQWDTNRACAGSRCVSIPASKWIIPVQPPLNRSSFQLHGGTSSWNTNTPTVKINLGRRRQIAGWVTPSSDPNDDNVGFWANSDTLLTSWKYTIIASRPKR
ncbi:MAG: hypothetical protein K8L99_07180 [Anaerolineae bacterium]|nr:hypothetical protein [Anaerolineae bacterium]